MNRYAAIDQDVISHYDYEDDEPDVVRGKARPAVNQGALRYISQALNQRREQQALRSGPGGPNQRRQVVYQITVRPIAAKSPINRENREYILKALKDAVDEFKPIAPTLEAGCLTFTVLTREEAEAVKSMSRRITERNKASNKYLISYKPMPAPWEFINRRIKDLINVALASRYIPEKLTLDLGDFASDKAFTANNVHAPLYQNGIMIAVAEAIREKYTDITGLSLKVSNCTAKPTVYAF
jgi:hypothetical protein